MLSVDSLHVSFEAYIILISEADSYTQLWFFIHVRWVGKCIFAGLVMNIVCWNSKWIASG